MERGRTAETGVGNETRVAPLSLAAAWIVANRAVCAQADRLRLLFDDPRRVAAAQQAAQMHMRLAMEPSGPMTAQAALYVLTYKPMYERRRARVPTDDVTFELGRRIHSAEEYLETRPHDIGAPFFEDARLIIATALLLEEAIAPLDRALEAADVLQSGVLREEHAVK